MAAPSFLTRRRGGGGSGKGGGRGSFSFPSSPKPAPAPKPAPPSKPAPLSKPASPPKSAPASPPSTKSPFTIPHTGIKSKPPPQDPYDRIFSSDPKGLKYPNNPNNREHGHNQGAAGHQTLDSKASPLHHGSRNHCGMKCSVGIGASFGGIVLIAIFLWVSLRRRRNSKSKTKGFSFVEASNKDFAQISREGQGKVIELGAQSSGVITPEAAYVK